MIVPRYRKRIRHLQIKELVCGRDEAMKESFLAGHPMGR
jgi:hypothetical protein